MADGVGLFTGEAGARVERAFGAHGVAVVAVDVAGAHVDTVERGEPSLAGGRAKLLHLGVHQVAAVAHRAGGVARPSRCHAGAAQRLAVGADRSQRNQPRGRSGDGFLDDRLERDLHEVVGERLRLEEVEQRRVAVNRRLVEVAADRDVGAVGHLLDVLDDLVEGALTASERPHPIMGLLVTIEGHLDAVESARFETVDDLGRQQQPVGDHVDPHLHTAGPGGVPEPFGHLEHHRLVEQRLAPEEGQGELTGAQSVDFPLDPVAERVSRLERHLVGVGVVVAVVALDAVVTGEVALQGHQRRDPQLTAVFSDLPEEPIEGGPLGVPALDQEAMIGQ